jgi:hypothetical protein
MYWPSLGQMGHYRNKIITLIKCWAEILSPFMSNEALSKLKKHYHKHVGKGIGPLLAK